MAWKRPSAAQRSLIFDRREKLELIRSSLMPGTLQLSRVMSRNVCDLLVQIELCTFPEGCFARMPVLASRIGLSRRRLQAVVNLAEDLGVLSVDRRRVDKRTGGRGPSQFRIQWDALRSLVPHQWVAEKTSERSEKIAERSAQISARFATPKTSYGEDVPTHAHARPTLTTLNPPSSYDGSGGDEGGGDFQILSLRLEGLGMGAADLAIERAADAGASCEEVAAVIDHWSSMRPAWDLGALYRRLCRMRPVKAAGDGWPRPCEAFEAQQLRDARREADDRRRSEQDEERRMIAAAARREQNIEAVYGPLLDGMAPDQLEQFAREQFADKPFLARLFAKRGIDRGLARDALLAALKEMEDASGKAR